MSAMFCKTICADDVEQTEHDLWSMYHAAMVAPHLGVDVNNGEILDKVLDLIQTDGSVR